MILNTLNYLGYEEIFCKDCGKPTNKSDGWCFHCNTTPKITSEKVFKESELKKLAINRIEYYIKGLIGKVSYNSEKEFNEVYKKATDINIEIKGRIDELMLLFNISYKDLKTSKSYNTMENTETTQAVETTEAESTEEVEKTETSETVETPVEKTDEAKTEESDEADTEETKD